jgi:hypothetical protein
LLGNSLEDERVRGHLSVGVLPNGGQDASQIHDALAVQAQSFDNRTADPARRWGFVFAIARTWKTELLVNEAIIDVGIGMAKFQNAYYAAFMLKVGCPGCNGDTMEYVEQDE